LCPLKDVERQRSFGGPANNRCLESALDSQSRTTGGEPAPERHLPSDADLLQSFCSSQDESAFTQLVARHLDLVYASAFRQTTNHALAQDITQAVFVILARKAPSLRRETVLSGWLFRAVRYAVLDAYKLDKRRQNREREAAEMEETHSTPGAADSAWEQMTPVLDEALAGLGDTNRHAVLLRFFEKKSFAEIAAVLGGNENSARLRVVRAVEKLRIHFRRRGVVLSAAVITESMLRQTAPAAPPVVAAAITEARPAPGVDAGPGSSRVAPLVRAVLRRLRERQERVVVAIMAAVALIILVSGGLVFWRYVSVARAAREAAGRDAAARAVRPVMIGIDRSFWFGDPGTFVALIHFRSPEEEAFRTVLTNYIRAEFSFRQEMKQVFNVQQRAFNATFAELCIGQPPVQAGFIGTHHVSTNIMMAKYPLHLIRIGETWKWDLFGGLSPEVRDQRMATLARKAVLLDSLSGQIRNKSATNVAEILHTVSR
jgi:RNA polymerase sigma factor (sigma-70 family)